MNSKHFFVSAALALTVLLGACNTTPAPEETPSNPDNAALAPQSGTVGGNLAVQRSQDWINRRLTYNTNATDAATGYRLDCSGFMAYVWGLPRPGADTQSIFNSYSIRVNRDDMVPGDALDYPPTGPTGHIIMFVRWSNRSSYDFVFRDFYATGVPVREGTARLEATSSAGLYRIVYTGSTGSGYMKGGVSFYALRNKGFQPLPDGTVVREVSNPKVFVLQGGAKYWIASEAILNTYFGGAANVRTVADGTLANTIEMPDGIVVKEAGSAYVYYISGNYRYWINTEAKFNTYYGGANNLRIVPNGALAGITYNGLAAPY